MKRCTSCNEVKSFSEFHRRGNVYKSHCKPCRKTREAEQSRLRSSRYYQENSNKALTSNRRWQEAHKDKMAKYKAVWRLRNKDKALAHWAVGNALRDGRLVRCPCEVCGEPQAQAHHKDYTRRLDVNWLCDYHHKERHGVLVNV